MPVADGEARARDIYDVEIVIPGVESRSAKRAYRIGDLVEEGGTCRTYAARWSGDDPPPMHCMKFVFKAFNDDISQRHIDDEIEMLETFRGVDEIIQISDTISSDWYRGYFCPMVEPGDLCSYLQLIKDRPMFFHPDDVKSLARDAFRGLRSMHQSNIAHGDIKLDNLLLRLHGDGSYGLVICDLGHARVMPREGGPGPPRWRVAPPTLNYRAPEVILDLQQAAMGFCDEPCGWGLPADIWSLGWVLFHLLTHGIPFPLCDENRPGSIRIHERAVLAHRLNVSCLDGVDGAPRDLVLRCLDYDPDTRITAEEALEHRWLQEVSDISGEIN